MMPEESPGTLVIQSHRDPLPLPWLPTCIDSVRNWSKHFGFDYRWFGDEIFESLPLDLRSKIRQQPVISSDLARLYALRQAMQEGYQMAVWCDADFLVIDTAALELPDEPFAFGREVWVQDEGHQQLRARVKIHNAFMLFQQGNAFLDFYIDSAERLIRLNEGGMPAQFVGPKLLTALHNMLHFSVIENAGMLSPEVMADISAGGGAALELFLKHHQIMPAGVNLSASLARHPLMSAIDMDVLIKQLTAYAGESRQD